MAKSWLRDPRFLDFDRAYAEGEFGQPPPLEVQFEGERWTLPADPPADIVLRRKRALAAYSRLVREQAALPEDERLSADEMLLQLVDLDEDNADFDVVDVYDALIGKDNVRVMRKKGVGNHKLAALAEWVEAVHDGRVEFPTTDDDDEDGGSGNGGSPDEGGEGGSAGTTSSKGGQRSKRRSKPTTAST